MRRIRFAVALTMTLVASPLSALANPSEPKLASRIDEARGEIAAGQLLEAAAILRRALEGPDPPEDPRLAAGAWLELAQVEVNVGKYRSALQAAERALRLYRGLDDARGTATALFRLGTAHDELAEYGDSQRYYDLALDAFREIGDRPGEADVLSGLGTHYRFLGDPERARRFYSQALAIYESLGRSDRVAWERRHLGNTLEDLGLPDAAREEYLEALRVLESLELSWPSADLKFHLGRLESQAGSAVLARDHLEQGLRLAEASQHRWAEARTLVELARMDARDGAFDRGLDAARRGTELLTEMGARDLAWEARFVEATLDESAGRLLEARIGYELALAGRDRVRASIGPPLLRTRYTPRVGPVFDALLGVELALSPDDPSLAGRSFAIAERYRARAFAEVLARASLVTSSMDSELAGRERALRGKIDALRTRLSRFPHTVTDPDLLEAELLDTERRHAAALTELGRTDAGYRELSIVDALDADAIVRSVGDEIDLVAYHLGERSSLVWHVGPNGIRQALLPPRSEIENLVLVLRSLLLHGTDPQALERVAGRLHETLLGPVSAALLPGRTLAIIPDGALYHLPFEMLRSTPAAGRPAGARLIERQPVFYLPSLTVLNQLRKRSASSSIPSELDLVAFGDPLPDPRGSETRLAHTATEVQRIGSFFRADRRVERTGAEASERELHRLGSRPTRILHLATHGLFDDLRPERSGLALSPSGEDGDDGYLGLFEIANLRFRTDLTVLSGCETARGKLLHGEGVVGLTRAFVLAGSRAVVASLWKVDDLETSRLMIDFYRHLSRGATSAEALRLAKLDRIAAGSGSDDPRSWAAFVLVGEGDVAIGFEPARRRLGWALAALGALLLGLSFLATAGTRRAKATRLRAGLLC